MIIAADHRGFKLKEFLLTKYGFRTDITPTYIAGDDYPDVAKKFLKALKKGEKGIIVCGSGTGVAIACNRHKGIRAVNAPDVSHAKMARKHEDANVLCIGANFIGKVSSTRIINAFLKTKFSGGRHLRRIKKL